MCHRPLRPTLSESDQWEPVEPPLRAAHPCQQPRASPRGPGRLWQIGLRTFCLDRRQQMPATNSMNSPNSTAIWRTSRVTLRARGSHSRRNPRLDEKRLILRVCIAILLLCCSARPEQLPCSHPVLGQDVMRGRVAARVVHCENAPQGHVLGGILVQSGSAGRSEVGDFLRCAWKSKARLLERLFGLVMR